MRPFARLMTATAVLALGAATLSGCAMPKLKTLARVNRLGDEAACAIPVGAVAFASWMRVAASCSAFPRRVWVGSAAAA